MRQDKQSKRALLLDAATHILLEQGAASLTLDAVAARAGVSKGGLLYHFPSKEALLKSMIERYLVEFCDCVEQTAAGLPDVRGRMLRAYVMTSLQDDRISSAMLVTLMGLIVDQPEMTQPIVRYYQDWLARVTADGTPHALAQIVILATDGVWLSGALHLPFPREAVQDDLLRLIARGAI